MRNFPAGSVIATVTSPWEVTFKGLSAPESSVCFDSLYDWKNSSDAAIKYFSGTATYTTTFQLPAVPRQQTYIDLGHVMAMGKVYVNGHYVGGVWAYPYRLNIAAFLKQGENKLKVEVINNWMNRLIGDQQLPEKERKTWAVFNPYTASSELQASGLLGPVTIQTYDYRIQ